VANAIYPKWKEALLDLTAGNDLNSGNVKALLVDGADYTYSSAHDFHNDVAAGSIVATSGNLASKTITNGVFDSADFTFTAVTGDPCEILIIYIDSGTSATSPLVAYYDTGVTGFPVTPNGGDINVTVHASGWFTL
jgi:hypothetical protein